MSDYAVSRSAHETLAADAVDNVTISKPGDEVEVTNRDGSAELYFTIDGTDPTVGGDDTFVLPAAICSRIVSQDQDASPVRVVKLISSGTPAYSVEAL